MPRFDAVSERKVGEDGRIGYTFRLTPEEATTLDQKITTGNYQDRTAWFREQCLGLPPLPKSNKSEERAAEKERQKAERAAQKAREAAERAAKKAAEAAEKAAAKAREAAEQAAAKAAAASPSRADIQAAPVAAGGKGKGKK